VIDGRLVAGHALDDVVDHGFSARIMSLTSTKPSTPPQVPRLISQRRPPAIDGILCPPSRSDLAPAAVQKAHLLPGDGCGEGLTIGSGERLRQGEVGQQRAPLRPGGDQNAHINLVAQPVQAFLPREAM
jgi:hypothetical protein